MLKIYLTTGVKERAREKKNSQQKQQQQQFDGMSQNALDSKSKNYIDMWVHYSRNHVYWYAYVVFENALSKLFNFFILHSNMQTYIFFSVSIFLCWAAFLFIPLTLFRISHLRA